MGFAPPQSSAALGAPGPRGVDEQVVLLVPQLVDGRVDNVARGLAHVHPKGPWYRFTVE